MELLLQKEENKAKAKKAAEAEEAQKKLADIMVEAQKKVRCSNTKALAHLHCLSITPPPDSSHQSMLQGQCRHGSCKEYCNAWLPPDALLFDIYMVSASQKHALVLTSCVLRSTAYPRHL